MPPRSKPTADHKPGQNSRHGYRFQKASDVRQSLRSQNEATLVEALTALRNQLTIKHEEHIAADDERLLLVKSWLDIDTGALDLFELWERTNTRQVSQLSLVLSVLSCVITLLSTHYAYHSYATPVIRGVLSAQWSSKLNSYLSTTHNELLLVTLKLYLTMSLFAGGIERRAILDVFPWELKSLPKLLHMRRRSKGEDGIDILARPDIRTLYVLFLLSTIDATTNSAVKTAFLDQRRENLLGIFKGLPQDSHTVVRRVLECCWTGLWCDLKIKRTAKINLFNEQTVQQILRLYERSVPEGDTQESIPADVAHHFLLAICTRPGTGICFRDRGWYPREDEDQTSVEPDFENGQRRSVRIYNKILAGILKSLKVNEDARQQELALRILEACPELVAGYWHAAALTLEPRLSSKWIANIAFFGLVISQPVPQASFILPGSDLYRPSPPSLSTILENILPSVNIKIHISRGLQSTSPLVQHCTALAFAKALTKLGDVVRSLSAAALALEEDAEEGQWMRRCREVEREAARRVPDFQVVVAFGQQKTAEMHAAAAAETKDNGALSRAALLAESAQRLLWLYHEHLPSLVTETRFDVGKLLAGLHEGTEEGSVGPNSGLVALRQLHVLRLLKESEDFSWTGKSGSKGNLQTLLRLYTRSNRRAMRFAVASLLRQTLSTTAAFQHDADEVDLWLEALPTTRRAPRAQAPDGTTLSDEAEAVIAFLDDCLQRCIKTPYRYHEELQALCKANNETQDPSILPSPMLATVLEQVQAKVNGNLLPPSDVLAVSTFVRKLMFTMAGKLPSLQLLDTVAASMGSLSFDAQYLGESVHAAVVRECQVLATARSQLIAPSASNTAEENAAVALFLHQVGQAGSEPNEIKERLAFELIDSLRFTSTYLTPEQLQSLLSAASGLSVSTVNTILNIISPVVGPVPGLGQALEKWSNQLNFTTVFLQLSASLADEPTSRGVLVGHLSTTSPVHIKRALRLVGHRLSAADAANTAGFMSLLTAIVQKVKISKSTALLEVKQFLFKLDAVQDFGKATLPSTSRIALGELLSEIIDTENVADRELISTITEFWAHELAENLQTLSEDQISTATTWLRVMDVPHILALFDRLSSAGYSDTKLPMVIQAMMVTLARSIKQGAASGIASRLPVLLSIQNIIPESVAWEKVIDIAVDACLPAFYDGKSLPDHGAQRSLSDVVTQSWSRWRALTSNTVSIELAPFLERTTWTDLTASIIARLTYSQASQRDAVVQWFRDGRWAIRLSRHITLVLQALFDTSLPLSFFSQEDDEILSTVCETLLAEMPGPFEHQLRRSVIFSIKAVADTHPAVGSKTVAYLQGQLKSRSFDSTLCELAMYLDPEGSLGSAVVDKGLKWAVDVFSDKTISAEDKETLVLLRRALERVEAKAHYAESVVSVVIQNHLSDQDALVFLQTVLSRVQFKPVTVNKYIQNVVQHPKFQILAHPGAEGNADARAAVVSLLHKLFNLHPTNTCQPSHVEPLQAVYGGILSTADCQLLSIFQLFETTRKASVSSLLSRWSPTPGSSCTTALEAIQGLDSVRVMKTCVSFPQYYDGGLSDCEAVPDIRVYDPVFVVLLFSRMLVEGVPTSALGWVQLFRSNVVSLLVRTLSSHKGAVRALAMSQVAGLYSVLQDADMQEKAHVLHILNLLKNTYPRNSPEEEPPRLPAFSTLHLAHALRGVFYPATFTYPLTARFLLQRYEFDTSDVPLLYSTLYSADDQWKKERTWIIRFLADGMVGRQEWRVLKRRHTWDLVASMFQSEAHDQNLRRGALELLANLTCNKAAATSLVLGSTLLSWIELQLQTVRVAEALAWVKIIENVIAVMDLSRLESATAGEWRAVTSRCLLRLLQDTVCDRDVLVHVVRIILCLSAVSVPPQELGTLIATATNQLHILEQDTPLQHATVLPFVSPEASHIASTLWQTRSEDALTLWGYCVESLWCASMATDEKTSAWDALTSRLLVWRAIVGADAARTGEWARREVVRSVGT